MKKQSIAAVAFAALLASGISAQALAQTNDQDVPGHPRVNEVDQRLQNQQNRIDNGVNNGKMNAKQEERDETRDSKVSQEMSADEAKHNGHITKAEQAHMNRQLNRNSKHIYNQKHDVKPASAPAPVAAPTTP